MSAPTPAMVAAFDQDKTHAERSLDAIIGHARDGMNRLSEFEAVGGLFLALKPQQPNQLAMLLTLALLRLASVDDKAVTR